MGRGGALVEEAKRLMADDDDGEMPAQNQESGPKIKMGRLGKRGKKPAAGSEPAEGESKSKATVGGAALSKGATMHPSGGFSE